MPAGAHEICLGLLRNIPSPFSDMSFEVVKNSPPKRKLDYSCLDNSFETLAKKPYIPSTASPDLGLGCDSFNVDTPTVNQQLPLDRQKAVRSQTKDADVKSHLNLSSSSGSCVLFEETESDGTTPNGQVYRGNVFDFNIESILCLSPISCVAGQPIGSDHNVEGCSCPRSSSPLASSPRAGQQVEEGVGQEEQSADWAREGNGASNSANAGHPSGGSIQFLATVSGSSKPLLKPLPLHCQLTTASRNRKLRDVPGNVSAPSGSSRAAVEALKGKGDEGIGAPVFESTICYSPGTGLGGGQHMVENSFEDSLPLHVQVGCACYTVMTELLNLIGHVAQQPQGRPWQHPSDLTTSLCLDITHSISHFERPHHSLTCSSRKWDRWSGCLIRSGARDKRSIMGRKAGIQGHFA
ncbi:hypothetical protein NHX12_019215 [Muraenolepis orangiensis]|uniref:Uncharacterized protein n=1 Tax=Muraenolepis orangiensis TaxID=630683 RepID=A0A9Q0IX05_9TELE|nr:hypothetical protein NHX12_019215 [Muraenolepis orangiensis]